MDVIFDRDNPQSRKSIMMLSRVSRERQLYRIQGVAEGRFRSIRPYAGDDAPDTKDFGEVLSRLARARGSIRCSLEVLEKEIHDLVHDVLSSISSTVTRCGSSEG